MGTDDDIIRNGTLWQWLNYEIVFGGLKAGEYARVGGKRIKAYWVVGALVLALVLALLF
jgi:hypothetical protein